MFANSEPGFGPMGSGRLALTGFANITATNGWAMAATGAFIVFVGLVALAFVISQLHKLLLIFERWTQSASKDRKGVDAATRETPAFSPPSILALDELKIIYRPLAEQLGEWFELAQLYELSRKMDLPHPHISIRQLREANILLSNDRGQFCWNPS